ncbi:hypothetical protein CMO89_00670 [Candidatus Woesearchaeota archaeon]|nr:hypothetical protein [Candidatus Woesearchaeota archaeon]|tara:strand:+ start:3305 stop:3592 length:288 start_codon:yes stop_codon:yes gene_type:complete
MDKITDKKLDKYLKLTSKAIKKVKLVKKGKVDFEKAGEDFLDMASRYYKDALFFKEKGDFVTAFAAINYAHGWLDAGARLGLFDVNRDSRLFTVD